jgi:hypothetical protein
MTNCKTFGTHQFFNLHSPDACCFGCGALPQLIDQTKIQANRPERKFRILFLKNQKIKEHNERRALKRLVSI